MKRVFQTCLALCALAMLLSPGVNASETFTQEHKQAIIDACTYDTEIDITQWNITATELEDLFYSLKGDGKLPWYTASYAYTYRETDELVYKFSPTNQEPDVYVRAIYEQRLAQLMDEAVHPGMTPVQIALSVHDWMIANCVYDASLDANTGYDLLVNGTTVCAGYAELYMDALNRLGIPCVRVTSEEMNHTWNLVQIDGSWYHVDVTWDDPSPDTLGYARHIYFLVSDQQISTGEEPHHGWDTNISCNSNRFADAWWKDVESPVCYENSDTCYLIRKNEDEVVYTLCRRNEVTGEETVLYTEEDHYIRTIDSGKRYAYGHFGLSLQNGRLYFGVLDEVLSVGTDAGDVRSEFSYDTAQNQKYILGVSALGNTAGIMLADHDGNRELTQFTLEHVSPGHSHSYQSTHTAPTCDTPGYTQWACTCGITCQSDVVAPMGHSFTVSRKRIATFWSDGFADESCDVCGFSHTRVLQQVDLGDWISINAPYLVIWAGTIIAGIAALTPVWVKKKK